MAEIPPALSALIDQVQTAVAENRADGPQAAAEQRCAAPLMGCDQPIPSLATAKR